MHSLTMADELRSFQFLDIKKTHKKKIGDCHLEYSYSMALASRNKCNKKQF